MPPTVYIETTIPSFYYEVRTEPDMVARRQWTRQWWDECRNLYSLVRRFRKHNYASLVRKTGAI